MKTNRFQPALWLILTTTLISTSAYSAENPVTALAGEARLFTGAGGKTMPYRIFTPTKLVKGMTYPNGT
jgi:hypothetical protein